MQNNFWRWIFLTTLAVMIIFGFGKRAEAVSYSGFVSTPEASGITAYNEWANGLYLGWVVDDTSNPGYWTYKYTFQDTSGQVKNLSHLIIEVSPTFSVNDVYAVNGAKSWELKTYSGDDPSNPGMPGSLYGIKFNAPDDPSNPITITLITQRSPVWGDFYAKDGKTDQKDNYAYNTGFLAADPVDGPGDGSINNHILVPDTQQVFVPEPGTLLLLGFGLLGIGGAARLRKRI